MDMKSKFLVMCHKLSRKSDIVCSAPFQCKVPVTKRWPCGHLLKQPCYQVTAPEEYPCKVLVTKLWPCGHQLKRPCYQITTPEEYPCTEACNKALFCGHPCTKKCGQACDDECQYICKQLLSCGHRCEGQCSQCATEHVHKLCPFKREIKRFCGHSMEISCSGLMDEHPGDRKISIICCHGSRQVRCSDAYRCRRECSWRCFHFKCSKRCYKMCDRPRCDERCTQKLKCGHRCYGLCGEPCLTVCPLCQLKLFEKKLHTGQFSKCNTYYELDCRHIFPVEYLDEYVHQLTNAQSHMLVCLIQCPVKECSRPLSRSCRYGNDVKQLFPHIKAVDKIVSVDKSNEDMKILTSRLNSLLSNEATSSIIFGCRSRITNLAPLSIDEKYIIFILIEVINVFEVLGEQSPPDGVAADYKKAMEEKESFLKKLRMFMITTKLTYQFVSDLQREFFRLYLKVYVLLVKSGSKAGLSGHHRVDPPEGVPLTPLPLIDAHLSVNSGGLCSPTQASSLEVSSDIQSESLDEDEKSSSHDTLSADFPESTLIVSDSLPITSSTNSKDHLDNSVSLSIREDNSVSLSIREDQFVDCEPISISSDEDAHVLFSTLSTECPPVAPPDPMLQAVPSCNEDVLNVEVKSPIVAAEEYLNDVPVKVTKRDIVAHCEAMSEPLKVTILDYKKMLEGIDHFYPVVQKGHWWRCPIKQEYYCLPPSPSDSDDDIKCPKCEGIRRYTFGTARLDSYCFHSLQAPIKEPKCFAKSSKQFKVITPPLLCQLFCNRVSTCGNRHFVHESKWLQPSPIKFRPSRINFSHHIIIIAMPSPLQ